MYIYINETVDPIILLWVLLSNLLCFSFYYSDISEQAIRFEPGELVFDTRQYRQSLPEGTELYWSLPNPFKGNKVLLKLNMLCLDSLISFLLYSDPTYRYFV